MYDYLKEKLVNMVATTNVIQDEILDQRKQIINLQTRIDALPNILLFIIKIIQTNGYGIITNDKIKHDLDNAKTESAFYGNITYRETLNKILQNKGSFDIQEYQYLFDLLRNYEDKQREIDKYNKDE